MGKMKDHNESALKSDGRIAQSTKYPVLKFVQSLVPIIRAHFYIARHHFSKIYTNLANYMHRYNRLAVGIVFLVAVCNSPAVFTQGIAPPLPGEELELNYFGGQLRSVFPLHQIKGRGDSWVDVNVKIQRNLIRGFGSYKVNPPEPSYAVDAYTLKQLYEDANFNSPKFHREYFESIEQNGAGYGPGMVYVKWAHSNAAGGWVDTNKNVISNIPSHIKHRAYILVYIDSRGRKHELIDQQVLTQVTKCISIASCGTYSMYRNINQTGLTYRDREDNKTVFTADTPILLFDDSTTPVGTSTRYSQLGVPGALVSGYLDLGNGVRMRIDNGYVTWQRDKNGNYSGYEYENIPTQNFNLGPREPYLKRVTNITDSINRQVSFQYDVQTSSGVADVITYKGINEQDQIIRVYKRPLEEVLQDGDSTKSLKELYDPSKHYQLENLSVNIKYNPIVYSGIESDGQQVSFKYNSYGELAEFSSSSGAKIKYTYGAPSGGQSVFSFNYEDFGFRNDSWFYYRRLREIKTYGLNDSLISRTEIDDTPISNYAQTIVEVKSYDSNNVLISKTDKKFFREFRTSKRQWDAGLEFEELRYAVNGGIAVPYSKKEKTWTRGPIGVTPGAGEYTWWDGDPNSLLLPELRRFTVQRTTLLDSSPNLVSETNWTYDEFLNVTSTKTYDWGQGARGPLVSQETSEYLRINPVTGANYLSTGWGRIVDLPLRTIIRDRNATPVKVAEYEYDNYVSDGNHSLITQRPNIINNCIQPSSSGQCDYPDPPTFLSRGNITAATIYKDPINRVNPVTTYYRYDVAGNIVSSKDQLGRETTTEFEDAFADNLNRNSYAFPTRTTSAIPDPTGIHASQESFETFVTYDYHTGLKISSTDENAQTTYFQYTDASGVPEPRNRIKKIIHPDTGWTSFDYDDTPGNIYVRTRTLVQGSPTEIIKDEYQYYDELLRPSRSYSYEPSASLAWVGVETSYNPQGKIEKISVPVRVLNQGDSIPANAPGTITEYDGLGREVKVTGSDDSVIYSSYLGNRTMVTDQAGKSRMIEKNIEDNVTKIVEYDRAITNPTQFSEPVGTDFVTTYEYNPFGKITKVIQGIQQRVFVYDALGRTVSTQNPESGQILLEYYDDGNLKKRTDNRGVVAEFEYDQLGRIIKKNYSPPTTGNPSYTLTPNVELFYDGKGIPSHIPSVTLAKGRLTATKSSVSEILYTNFDAMGRVTAHRQVVNPLEPSRQEFLMEYAYNLAGTLISQKYPSGKIITTEVDDANRISGVRKGNFFYAGGHSADLNRIKYTENGDVKAIRFGNGLWQHNSYNDRRQPTEIGVGIGQSDSSILKLEYAYGTLVNNNLDSLKNNGNVQSQRITLPNGAVLTQAFVFDHLNRLKSVEEENQDGTQSFVQTFNYDQYGNRTIEISSTTGSLIDADITINPSNNRISTNGYSYDSGGNLVQTPEGVGIHQFTYDAENRLSRHSFGQSSVTQYHYDGDGKRIRIVSGDGIVENSTLFVYNINGQIIAEYSDQPNTNGQVNYLSQDHLGSTRLVTDAQGLVVSRHDYLPFGEEIEPAAVNSGRENTPTYNQGDIRQKYAGKERDPESGLDYFGARYYSAGLGRFMSPDAPFADQHAQNPQSWNLYSYTRNNPVRSADKNGRWNPLDILDVVGILWDGFQYLREPTIENAAWLTASITAAFLPEVPSPTTLRWADEAIDVARLGAEAVAVATTEFQEARFVAASVDNAVNIGNDASRLLGPSDETFEGGKSFFEFYTIQNADDAARLTSTGTPWPDSATRAQFGTGVYAWGTSDDAVKYMNTLNDHGVEGLQMVKFTVSIDAVDAMRKLDIDSLGNAGAEAFMQRYSRLWGGNPDHGFDMLTRGTQFGTEHFFSSNVYNALNWSP